MSSADSGGASRTTLDEIAGVVADLLRGAASREPRTRMEAASSAAALAALAALDSLGRLELLAVLEERFDVALTEDLVLEFESPERIARIVRDARAARVEPPAE